MKKRILAILMVVCLVLAMAPAALAAGALFTDVNEDSWFAPAVEYACTEGIMTGIGDGAFDPHGTVTRAMVWVTLARMDGEDTDGSSPWWAAGQQWAVEHEISDGTMPEQEVTREQLVTMLWRYAKYSGVDVGVADALLEYTDADAVSDWAMEAVQWACGVGIINGIDGEIRPQGAASRAQLAVMVYRLAEGVEAEDVETEESESDTVVEVEYSGVTPHTHTYADEWSYDSETHWKEAVCHSGRKSRQAAHTVADGKCSVCGVYVVTDTGLERALHFAEPGSIIWLKEGVDYGKVYVGNGHGVTEVPANLTIVGATGASVDLVIRSAFNITGWTFDGVTFAGEGFRINNGASGDAITFRDCVFGEGTSLYTLKNNGGYVKDVLITGCFFSGNSSSAIILQNAENVTVSECSFVNAGHNAVQMTGTKGVIVISDNTISGTTDRALRFSNTSAKITVSDNQIFTDGDDKGQVMKVDGTFVVDDVTLTDNTWNHYDDEMLGHNNGVWSLPVEVASEEELIAAVSANGTVILKADIELSSMLSFPAGKTITLDLNGYDISYAVENTGNSNKVALEIKGVVKITGEGELSIVTTGIDMGWNAMSAVVFANGGSVTIGSDVVVKNLGGTSMAFALDMNPWGSGPMTIDLNGTTLESTYIPIRVRDGGSTDITLTATGCTLASTRTNGNLYAIWLQCYDSASYTSKTIAHLNNCTFIGDVLGAECDNSVIYVDGVADTN